MTRDEFDAYLREQIAAGELKPEEAESEWDFYVNGMDTIQNIYGI